MQFEGSLWSSICNIANRDTVVEKIIKSGIWLMVGNGQHILFWKDPWLSDQCLKNKFRRLFAISIQKGQAISQCGFWNGFEWVWSLQWRRQLFEWEKHLLDDLNILLL